MTTKEQAERLINRYYELIASGSCNDEALAVKCAYECAQNIAANIGDSVNGEYWAEVLQYFKAAYSQFFVN
jgi:hypothetical protein